MKLKFIHEKQSLQYDIQLPASKSISNRILVLKHLYFPNLILQNLSEAHDTGVMQSLLDDFEKKSTLNVEDAGTVARFITAVAALNENEHLIRGAPRMHQRPIASLLNALRNLGAEITCLENEGYLPIRIKKGPFVTDELEISTEESSQFFSAILMIAPAINQSLKLKIKGKVNSAPYIKMTLLLMQRLKMPVSLTEEGIQSIPFESRTDKITLTIENDWSSVAFFLEYLSFQKAGFTIKFKGLESSHQSMQGDAVLMDWAPLLGCKAEQNVTGITFTKEKTVTQLPGVIDFSDYPDLSLPLITAWAAQKLDFAVTGVETLKHKESDRLKALESELNKCGVVFKDNGHNVYINGSAFHLPENIKFSTYNDHRITMSLAMLAFYGEIDIEDPMNVSKSFPAFWNEIHKLGIRALN